MNRIRFGAATALVLGWATLSACGSTASNTSTDAGNHPDASPLGDAGHPDATHADATPDAPSDATPDVATDAGVDAPPDCGNLPPNGTQLVKSTDPLILQRSVTSDGYGVYEDSNTQVLYAFPFDGGAPANLGTVTSQASSLLVNGGKGILFLPTPTSPTSELAPLSAWSAASGASVISTSVFAYDAYYYTYDVSADGQWVAYFASGTGSAANLMVSSIDGKTQIVAAASVDLTLYNQQTGQPLCSPAVQFVGDTLVAYYCTNTPAGDAAITDALTIASFAAPNFAQTTIAILPTPAANSALAGPALVSADHQNLLLTAFGQGIPNVALYPIAGGAPTVIDPTGVQAFFTKNGDILVVDSSGALYRYSENGAGTVDGGAADAATDASTDAASADAGDAGTNDAGTNDAGGTGGPLTLVASAAQVLEILALSPDTSSLLLATAYDQTTGYTNVQLASAVTPGPLVSAWSPSTAQALGFTADSNFELFVTNIPTGDGVAPVDLYASPSAGGAATKVASLLQLAVTTKSKLVVGVNPTKTTAGIDLQSIDLASPSATTTVVTQADEYFTYARSTNQLIYSWHCAATDSAGIWSIPAP